MRITYNFNDDISSNLDFYKGSDLFFTITADIEFCFADDQIVELCEASPLHILFSLVDSGYELYTKKSPVSITDVYGSNLNLSINDKRTIHIKFKNIFLPGVDVEHMAFYNSIYEFGNNLFSDLIGKFAGHRIAIELKKMRRELLLKQEKLDKIRLLN